MPELRLCVRCNTAPHKLEHPAPPHPASPRRTTRREQPLRRHALQAGARFTAGIQAGRPRHQQAGAHMDFVVRNARLSSAPDGPPVDIGIAGGMIVALQPDLPAGVPSYDAPSYDAGGLLACAGLIETHIHLDKTRIIDRCAPEVGRNAAAVPRVAAVKSTFTEEDVYQRASITLENCIKHGTTRMRTHVELDAGVDMRSFDALERLRRDYAWAIDIELCVFPQEGLTNNKRSDELLVQALKRGAQVIGAAPNYDPDKSGQIRRIFELAREYDADIDMHLDSGNSPAAMDIHLVCALTKQYGLGGRVAVGHGCKYSTLPPRDFRLLAA